MFDRRVRHSGQIRVLCAVIAIVSAGSLAPVLTRAQGQPRALETIALDVTVNCGGISLTPQLSLALGVNAPAAIPGDTLTYTATVTNAATQLGITGTVTTSNADDENGIRIVAYRDIIEYYSRPAHTWIALAGTEAQLAGQTPLAPTPPPGLTLAATPPTRTGGVTYPAAGDRILGTSLPNHHEASWTYAASLSLTPAQSALLADAKRTGRLREEFTLLSDDSDSKPSTQSRPVFNPFHPVQQSDDSDDRDGPSQCGSSDDDEDFHGGAHRTASACPAPLSGIARNVTVAITPGSAATVTLTQAQVRALASIAPGAAVPVTTTYRVPLITPKATGETDAQYLGRLSNAEGSAISAVSTATGTSSAGTALHAGPVTAATTAHLPIVGITKTGPATAAAGTTATYGIGLQNSGGATAGALTVSDTLPDATVLTVTGVPATLAAAASATAQATYAIPAPQPAGPLADTAALTWKDANGNSYGPVSSTFTTQVTSSFAGAKLALSPVTAGPDVTGTQQTMSVTFTDSANHPLANDAVTLTVTGANPSTTPLITDANGAASFTYTGTNNGTDSAQAMFTSGAMSVQSNTASISWVTPVAAVSTTSITGQFYAGGCGSFCGNVSLPLWAQQFPTIDFNPPAGTIPGNNTGVGDSTRPFTDITTDVSGNFAGTEVAQGNGQQAGVGALYAFDATFTGTFIVAAAGDQTFNFYSDDGFIFGAGGGATRVSGADANPPPVTYLNGYPIMGAYNGPTSPVANQITVNFPHAGTYPYEVDYSECCGGQVSLTMAAAANGHGVPPAGNLTLTPQTLPTQTIGQPVHVTVSATDAGGQPIANLPVLLNVGGVNAQQVTGTTGANGLAVLSYGGANPGADALVVNATVSGSPAVSNEVDVTWAFGSGSSSTSPPPVITNPAPADGSVVTAPVPLSATFAPPTGQTITAWSVSYQGAAPGSSSVQLASGISAPPATLATFDPTALPNDSYTITFSATASGGGTQTVATTVAVNGNLKLGRYTVTYQDMNVPVSGFPMQVLRTYDSDLAQRSGDFGNGWHVSLSNFTVSSNRQLGAGGWTLYPTSCVFGLCSYGYKSSAPHYVTVTWPDGHQEVFDFTPTGGSAILYTQGTSGFTARLGTNTTSSLQIDGDQSANYAFDGNLYNGSGIINPTRFDLTTRDGTKLILDTTTCLVSETDRTGNSLTVDGSGIHSSAGPSITFTRDGSGRITQVTGPVAGQTLTYAYDGGGNLASMTDPVGNVVTNTYDGQHHLLTTTGQGRTQPLQAMTYDASGRLTGITDAKGNTTAVSDNVAGRQQTVTDPNGLLITVDTFDDKGDLLQEQQHTGSQVLTTTASYDADGRPLTRTDPAGHTWTGTYDAGGDITSLTLPSGHQTAVTYNSFGAPLTVTDALGHVTTYAYDGTTGSLVSVKDANGNTETYTYDAQGHLITKTDALNQVTTYGYDGNGNLTSTTDPLGHATTSTYDSAGHLLTSTDALGRSTQSTYDGDSQLLTVTDPLARVTTYTYNDLHKVASKKDAAGNVTTYGYDAAGHLTLQTDPLGHATAYGYDVDGRYISTADPLGHTTTFGYNGLGQLVSTTDPLGRVTGNTFDAAGRLTTTTLPNGGVSHDGYDADGNKTTVTDPLGHTTTSAYDAAGRVSSITDPGGNATTNSYDPDGNQTATTAATGGVSATSYDADLRIAAVTDPLGHATTYGYDAAGNRTTVTDPTGVVTTTGYDAANHVTSTTNGAGQTTQQHYDVAGELTSTVLPSGVTTTNGYDLLGRQTSLVDGLGHATATTYDAAGRQTSQTDANGHATTYGYDAANHQTTITDALNGHVTVGYDAAGQTTSTTDADGRITTFGYDPLGNVASETDPGNRVTASTYDLAGDLHTKTDPRGITVTDSYDPAGNLTTEQYPTGQNTYAFDTLNRRVSMTDTTGVTTTGYDAASNVTKVGSPEGVVAYTYDGANRRATMTQPQGQVQYGHDTAGRVSSVQDWTGATTHVGYTTDGLTSQLTLGNGAQVAYGYDGADRLTSVHADTSTSTAIAHFDYTLDPAGNRTAMTSAAGTEAYTLDALNRLTNVSYPGGQTQGYSYDAAGNRTSATVDAATSNYTYNTAGELAQAGSTAFGHDAAGNQTSAGTQTYAYDYANRLTSATAGAATTTYGYDANGARVTTTSGATTTHSLYDTQQAEPQLINDGTTSYVSADGALVSEITGAGTAYPVQDALGSVRTLTSSTQAVTGTTGYDVFGAVRSQTGAQSALGFTGRQSGATGLLNLNARYLNPGTGQFQSADSLQPNAPGTQGYSSYAYAGNNPTTATDPSGHEALVEFAIRVKDTASEIVASAQARVAYLLVTRFALLECIAGNALNIGTLACAQANGAQLSPGQLGLYSAGGIPDCGAILAARAARGAGGGASGPPPTSVSELPEANLVGSVERNSLNEQEYEQAQQIVGLKGGTFTGQTTSNQPGIDGTLNGIPVSLKGTGSGSPSSILTLASKAEVSAQKAGYTDVELYISAPNLSTATVVNFAPNGGLIQIPHQGTIRVIYVHTADGWVQIGG